MSAFSDDAKVKLIYLRDSSISKRQVIYQGDIAGFRNNLSLINFNGFKKGQRFTIVEEDVIILNKFEVINSDSLITNVIYITVPEQINEN